MSEFRRMGLRRRAATLIAGGAVSFLFASTAMSQTMVELPVRAPGTPTPMLPSELPHHGPPPPPPVIGDDGLGQKGFYLEADTLIRDDKADRWTAQGGVEVRNQGRTLRADEVIYDVSTGVVTANGHAQIIQPDGTVESGEHIVLDQKMRTGFARVFAVHGPDNSTIAADVAVRRSQSVNELTRAVFTPCAICAQNGSPITPTWAIQATKVVQDHDRHLVYYRNAVILVKGIPVFYTPVFWHPDPQSARQSGLLIPRQISTTAKLGVSYAQPYLQVISPSQELTITPQINSAQNPFLTLEWRERFYSGEIDARVGYTYSADFDSEGHRFGNTTSRSFILANGHFDVNNNWSWGFTADRASDPLIFEKYDVPKVYNDQGLYQTDTQRLLSQLFATREDSDSYISITAMDFQGLRTNPAGVTENSASFPVISPLIEARYEPAVEIWGGRIRFVGSAVVESTPQSDVNVIDPGLDDRRATVEADWQRNFTLANGMRLSPFVAVRGDFYNVQNLTTTDTADRSIGRSLGTAGLDLSWPFIKDMGDATVVLEPLAQLAISPNTTLTSKIPNTDSVTNAFDETNLFSTDRFSGFDLYEGGQRLNLGGRATVDWGAGLNAQFLLGRSFRAEPTNIFSPGTGLNNTASDWVLAANTTPMNGLSVFSRALLNDDLQSDLTEVGIDYARSRFRGYVRYDDDNTQPTGRTRDIEGAGEVFVTRHWGVSLVGIRDIETNEWRRRDVGVVYMDDCVRVEVVYQHSNTIVGRLGASDSVFVRLTLATLGDEGYRNADFR